MALEPMGHALEAGDSTAAVEMLADDVVLRVAVHDQPFSGRAAAAQILSVVLDGPLHHIEVTEIIEGVDAEVLLFRATVKGHPAPVDGLLVSRTGADGLIVDLTVFLRPLAALQALADEMGRRLGGPRPDGTG